MKQRCYLFTPVFALLLCLLTFMPKASAPGHGYMDETYRPQFHYTAEKGMINDPNGLVYYNGVWHLFHQYNIFDAIHWGHATSTDLIHWTPQQPALAPDRIGQIWSGSIVVDANNTSGLQRGTESVLVSVFTYSEHNGGTQSQGIAYSNDAGNTWTMYSGNPVIPNPGQKDFRDPKVFWHAETNKWVMVLTGGDHVEFYTSPNLKDWTFAGNWGHNQGAHGGNWECPDLFEMTLEGTTTKKWVLSVSVMNGSPAGGTGMQYFVGDFNGTTFVNDNSPETALWQNYGRDYYAGVTWNNVPSSDGRRLMIAWADNWQYRFDLPTTPFNGQLSLIRELKLKAFPEGVRLTETPIAEYESLRESPQTWTNQIVTPTTNLLSGVSGDCLEIVAEFQADTATASEFGIKVRKGVSQSTVVGYDKTKSYMFVDRTVSGVIPNPTGSNPNPNWSGKHTAPLSQVNGKITLHIFVDRSSVEVFGNDREGISDLILPDRTSLGLETYAIGGNVTLNSLKVYPMNRIWNTSSPLTSTNLTGWTTVQGEWADTINSKEGSADQDGFILTSQQGSDFTYSADIKIKGVNPGNLKPIKQEAAGGLVFRANETATEGYVANINARTGTVNLLKYNKNGSVETLGTYHTTLQSNTTYNLKVTTSGSSIKVYLNQALIIDKDDSTYRSGAVGLNVWNTVADFNEVYYTNMTDFATDIKGWVESANVQKLDSWNVVSGTWIDMKDGKQGTASGDGFTMSMQTADNFTYEADVNISGLIGGKGVASLVFRANSTATQGYVANVDALNDFVTLFKFNGDGTSTVIKRFSYSFATDRIYHLTVRAYADHIQVYLDRKKLIDEKDSSFRTGLLGLNVWNSQSSITNITFTPQEN